MLALRADQWLENHPEADDATRRAIKQQVRDAFYIDTDAWKEQIVAQGIDAAYGAVRGLSATGLGAPMSLATAGPATAASPRPRRRQRRAPKHPTGTLAATILGSSLAFIDGSVVNVGLPAIERDLASSGASGASIGWLDQRLPAAARRAAPARRRRRRSLRPKEDVARRHGALQRRLARLRARAGFRLAARRARRAGDRRCPADAGEPGSPRRRVQRRSARPCGRHLGRGRRRLRRARPARRRLADRHRRLALDLLRQPADRRRRRRGSPGATSTRAGATMRRRSTSAARHSRPSGSASLTYGLTVVAARGRQRALRASAPAAPIGLVASAPACSR